MTLHLKIITGAFDDFDKFEKINNDAFPEEERVPADMLIEASNYENMDLLAIYDADEFIGFFITSAKNPCVYISFFAIDREKRSKGYGSKALDLLDQHYSGYQIVLDLEKPDSTVANNEQRITRKQFYLRNGYKESGYFMDYVGITFEILYKGNDFEKDGFLSLIDQIKLLVNRFRTVKFEPIIYKSSK